MDSEHLLSSVGNDAMPCAIAFPLGLYLNSRTALLTSQVSIHLTYTHTAQLSLLSHVGHDNLSTGPVCLQCFDAVGWAAGRAPGL